MLVIPSIDLLEGRGVRLRKGRFEEKTVYVDDPVGAVKEFEEAGARWVHVVDLDAVRGYGANNRGIIRDIRKSVSCKVEVGGGIRTEDDVQELLDIEVDRLVLGTLLVRDPDRVSRWVARFGRVFAGGLDALDGTVRTHGWEGDSSMADTELAGRLEEMGMRGIIYTNISRDGTLSGPDIEGTNRIAGSTSLPVILSGGIGSESDFRAVFEKRHSGVKGIITGKALYEKKFSLAEVIGEFGEDSDGW